MFAKALFPIDRMLPSTAWILPCICLIGAGKLLAAPVELGSFSFNNLHALRESNVPDMVLSEPRVDPQGLSAQSNHFSEAQHFWNAVQIAQSTGRFDQTVWEPSSAVGHLLIPQAETSLYASTLAQLDQHHVHPNPYQSSSNVVWSTPSIPAITAVTALSVYGLLHGLQEAGNGQPRIAQLWKPRDYSLSFTPSQVESSHYPADPLDQYEVTNYGHGQSNLMGGTLLENVLPPSSGLDPDKWSESWGIWHLANNEIAASRTSDEAAKGAEPASFYHASGAQRNPSSEQIEPNTAKKLTRSQKDYAKLRNDPIKWAAHKEKERNRRKQGGDALRLKSNEVRRISRQKLHARLKSDPARWDQYRKERNAKLRVKHQMIKQEDPLRFERLKESQRLNYRRNKLERELKNLIEDPNGEKQARKRKAGQLEIFDSLNNAVLPPSSHNDGSTASH